MERLGTHTPVPVEVVPFGLEVTRAAFGCWAPAGGSMSRKASRSSPTAATTSSTAASGRSLIPRASRSASGASSASSKAACSSAAPARFSSPTAGVHRSTAPRPSWQTAGPGGHGRVRRGKSTVAQELARAGCAIEEATRLTQRRTSPDARRVAADRCYRQPWLERVAAWIDGQRARKSTGHRPARR